MHRRAVVLALVLVLGAGGAWWATSRDGGLLPPAAAATEDARGGNAEPAAASSPTGGGRQTAATARSAPSSITAPTQPAHPCGAHVEVVNEAGAALGGCRVVRPGTGEASVTDALGRASLTIDGDVDWLEVHGR